MAEDFLDELGELALGSRLKRLSERMMADAGQVYQHFGMEVQPKWFTLLALLHVEERVGVVEAAERLGLSQPAISQFSRQLNALGIVTTTVCPDDSRRKVMVLTEKGKQQVAQMQPVWLAVEKAAKELCTALENNFYPALQKYEQALNQKSLFQRTLEAYDDQ